MNHPDAPARLRTALLSNTTDALGSQLLTLTIDLLAVASLGFTATQVGLLNALGTISYLLLAVPLGMLVDAQGPLRALTTSLTIKVVLAIATLVLLATAHLGVVEAMLLSLAFGIAAVATETAQTTLVPHLSEHPAEITATVARMASADQMAGILCPAIVGVGVAQHAGLGLLTSALFLLIAALVCLARLTTTDTHNSADHPHETATHTPDDPSNRRSTDAPGPASATDTGLTAGFRVIAATPNLLGVTMLVTAGNIGLAIGDSVEAILVIRHLHLGSSFYGLLGTLGAIAGLGASIIAPRIVGAQHLTRLFAVGGLTQATVAGLPLLALNAPSVARPILVAFTIGWALVMTMCNIAGAAYTASHVPRPTLGRATAASRTITMGSIPLAAFTGGMLADHFGIAAPLTIWPLLTLLAAVMFLVLSRLNHRTHGAADAQ